MPKFNEISVGVRAKTPEELQSVAVAEFLANCPIAPYAQFYSVTGNADTPRKTDAVLTGGENRAIGESYTPVNNTPGFEPVALKVYGGAVKTDEAYERRGIDIGSQRAKDLANYSASMGRQFMDSFINDTADAKHFNGLKHWCQSLTRVNNYDATLPNGNSSADRVSQNNFLELVDRMIGDMPGGPDCLVLNSFLKARFRSLARNFITVVNVQDVYGRNQVVELYGSIPLVDAGFKANNVGLIIPNDATAGTTLYAVKFGEEENATFATNVGLCIGDEGKVGSQYVTTVEYDVDFVVLNPKAVNCIAGIKL